MSCILEVDSGSRIYRGEKPVALLQCYSGEMRALKGQIYLQYLKTQFLETKRQTSVTVIKIVGSQLVLHGPPVMLLSIVSPHSIGAVSTVN